jgi:hypothetical protein
LADQGHVFAPRDHLVEAAVKILEVPNPLVEAQVDVLATEERVKIEPVTLPGATTPA